MKNLLIAIFIISFNGILMGQQCPDISTYNQVSLDNWVTANAGTCNVLGELTLNADLDYSGLNFIDTIDGTFRIAIDITSLNGFQNVKHVGSLRIGTFNGVNLPNLNVLDIKSVDEDINIYGATIPDLSFMVDVITVPDALYLHNVTYTNPSNLALPNLIKVGYLTVQESSAINDLGIFSNLNYASHLTLSSTTINDMQAIQFIDTIHNLSLRSNSQLTNVDLSGFDYLEKLSMSYGVINTISNLNVDTLKLLSIYEGPLTDLSFLNQVNTLQSLYLNGTLINSLAALSNIPITQSLDIIGNRYLVDFSGLESTTSLDELEIYGNYNLTSIDHLSNLV